MRLLHTSDWHVGRTTYNKSRHPDFVKVFDEIIEIARTRHPDLILNTGDLLDHARVSHSDINLAASCLGELSKVAPVVVVAGNHDSAMLLDAFNLLHAGDQIHFVTTPRGRKGDYLTFPGSDGITLRLGALPFVNTSRAIDVFDDPAQWAGDYRHRIAAIQNQIAEHLNHDLDPQKTVTVFAAHLFVTGAGLGGTEREAHVSGDYGTHPDDMPHVDYAAFGHIHQAQQLPGPVAGRYAGSPLALDFGEAGQTKSVTLVDLAPGTPAFIEEVPLRGGRALRTFTGTLNELAAAAGEIEDALCVIEINTETHDPVLSQRVHELLPRATVLQIRQNAADGRAFPSVVLPDMPTASGDLLERFITYIADQNTSPAPADRVIAVLAELLDAHAEDREPSFPQEALLPTGASTSADRGGMA
ncbi:metallophosphoesterase family protein [Micromonospora tulbaghiae]|uniref:Nuclease SbcCD subunit D n=1 Tax=Micromonospora tulbaghiae TaxID=479978 RepID=A0ABY0KQP4_9ACTN|nr:exonuclease SbcCD subunit D [Micromonospora tulbaghiae]SCF01065.1 Exodeoxyribonuclease I subunit D [Micromonospora tulbaghiae]